MSAENQTQSIDEKYQTELSVGTYTYKKIREVVVTLGSGVIGLWGGSMIARLSGRLNQPAGKLMGMEVNPGAVIGGFIGLVTGGLVLGYEHWLKGEREKKGIEELQAKTSNITAIEPTDKELVEDHKRLRQMLDEKTEQNNKLEALLKQGARSPSQHAQREEDLSSGLVH